MRQPAHPQIREAIARLCAGFPGACWPDLDARMVDPTAFIAALTRSRFLATMIPETHGSAGCSGGAAHARMHITGTLLRHGSDVQKARWLPEIAARRLRLQAFGLAEPGSGSGTDTRALATTARRDDEVARKGERLSVALVDLPDSLKQGMTIRPIQTMMNHSTTGIWFDDVPVPAAAGLMVHAAADAHAAGEHCGGEATMAKMLAADASCKAANMRLHTHGGFGFVADHDIGRKFRLPRLCLVAPNCTNLMRAYLAEHVLGLPRSC